jgi:hypothetical protein
LRRAAHGVVDAALNRAHSGLPVVAGSELRAWCGRVIRAIRRPPALCCRLRN